MNSFKLFFAAFALSGTCCFPALAEEPQMNTNSYRGGEKEIVVIEGKVLNKTIRSAKNTCAEEQEPERIIEAVEQQAQFPGGNRALNSWLAHNLCYPELAQQNNIEGRVIVQFVVEKDGRITHPVIARGVDKNLDMEAIRVVMTMPKWAPARNNGLTVRSKFTLPIVFKLKREESTNTEQ